jgi:hypothetical protein
MEHVDHSSVFSLYKSGLLQASLVQDLSLFWDHHADRNKHVTCIRHREGQKCGFRINCISPKQCLVAISLKWLMALRVLRDATSGSVDCFLLAQLNLSHFFESSFRSEEGRLSCCTGVAGECEVLERVPQVITSPKLLSLSWWNVVFVLYTFKTGMHCFRARNAYAGCLFFFPLLWYAGYFLESVGLWTPSIGRNSK